MYGLKAVFDVGVLSSLNYESEISCYLLFIENLMLIWLLDRI